MTLPSSHRPPPLSGQAPLLSVDFGVDSCSFPTVFGQFWGQKRPKSTRNRLLLKGLLRVLGGAGERGLWVLEKVQATMVQMVEDRTPSSEGRRAALDSLKWINVERNFPQGTLISVPLALRVTMRPKMITQIIRKLFFCVTNVRVIGKLISRQP